jgi:hypothetical protein
MMHLESPAFAQISLFPITRADMQVAPLKVVLIPLS